MNAPESGSLGDSVAVSFMNVVSGSRDYRTENMGISSSTRQCGILTHKRIHIYDQYNF